MKIVIDFGHPYFEESTIFELWLKDLEDFYVHANKVNQLNLFFVLEVSLYRFQSENNKKAAAHCAYLMSYYIIILLELPALYEFGEYYIDKALEWNETPQYRKWKNFIDGAKK